MKDIVLLVISNVLYASECLNQKKHVHVYSYDGFFAYMCFNHTHTHTHTHTYIYIYNEHCIYMYLITDVTNNYNGLGFSSLAKFVVHVIIFFVYFIF